MDTSETNIKMCDCPEIQEQAKRSDDYDPHDYFWYPPSVEGTAKVEHASFIAVIGDAENCGHCLSYYVDRLHEAIWLPLQHQLQMMVWGGDWIVQQMRLYNITNALSSSDEGYREQIKYWAQFKSWEQLWLGFVMHELHQKEWDGDKWIKEI